MSIALLMDIDGTLTPPRLTVKKEMVDALNRLVVPFNVAAGSHLELVKPQFLEPLYEMGFRRDFDAFLSNGGTHYRCPYSKEFAINLVEEFDFRKHLGEDDYATMVSALKDVLNDEKFKLPSSCKVIGERIVDRRSMLNFAPIGRPKGNLKKEGIDNRDEFVKYDKEIGYRKMVLAHLTERLSKIMETKKLFILLGGQTSFDFVIEGKDKTNGYHTLRSQGVDEVYFIGDALHEFGNDWVITRFIENWNQDTPCPLKAVEVDSWHDTIQAFKDHNWMEKL